MKTQKSLLEGAPYKHLIRLSLPLVIGNCLQQLYNTIDAMVIGHFAGMNHFAAIGLAGSIMNLFLFAIIGACSGVTIMFSQLYGSDNVDAFCKEHYLALTLGSLLAFLLGILGIMATPWLLSMTMTPAELLSAAKCYLQIVLLGLPVTYLFNLYCSMLRSIGNTNAALGILICSTIINLILDLFFIGKLDMGISGAAIATISAIIAIYYIKKKADSLLFQKKHRHIDLDLMNKTAKLSFVTAFQQCSLYLGKIVVQGSVNSLGVDAISAFTAAGRVEGFINSFGDSGALATSILVAQNQGAKKENRVKESFWHSMLLLFLFGSLCAVLLRFLAPAAVAFVMGTSTGAAYDSAVKYLLMISFFYVFCFTGSTFSGYFSGTNRPMIAFLGSASHITLRAFLCSRFIHLHGLSYVAIATGIGWILVNIGWTIVLKGVRPIKF